MPSRPSLARTVRKEAGTETRPLVSILLVKVETNWSISPSRTRSRHGTNSKAGGAGSCPQNDGRGGADPPVASKERGQPLPFTHRTGNHGITWDFMGVNGARPGVHEFRTGKRGNRRPSSSFLVIAAIAACGRSGLQRQ